MDEVFTTDRVEDMMYGCKGDVESRVDFALDIIADKFSKLPKDNLYQIETVLRLATNKLEISALMDFGNQLLVANESDELKEVIAAQWVKNLARSYHGTTIPGAMFDDADDLKQLILQVANCGHAAGRDKGGASSLMRDIGETGRHGANLKFLLPIMVEVRRIDNMMGDALCEGYMKATGGALHYFEMFIRSFDTEKKA